MVRVDFHSFFRNHIRSHGGISKGLSFHDSFHISGPTEFTSNKDTWRISNSLSNENFFNFITEDFFDKFTEGRERSFLFFEFLFFVFSVSEIETGFWAVSKFFTIIFFELLDDVFINRVNHIDNFKISFFKGFNERRVGNSRFRFTSDEVNFFLVFLHSFDVVF
jgi:hypothetical protein